MAAPYQSHFRSLLRSIVASVLIVVTVLVIGFTDAAAAKPAKPLTYTATQIEDIQAALSDVTAMRDRMPELKTLIDNKDGIFARNFIHGPLGELRFALSQTARNLLPDAQKQARQFAKEIANDLVEIDQASAANDYKAATRYYNEAQKDFDAFYALIPQAQ